MRIPRASSGASSPPLTAASTRGCRGTALAAASPRAPPPARPFRRSSRRGAGRRAGGRRSALLGTAAGMPAAAAARTAATRKSGGRSIGASMPWQQPCRRLLLPPPLPLRRRRRRRHHPRGPGRPRPSCCPRCPRARRRRRTCRCCRRPPLARAALRRRCRRPAAARRSRPRRRAWAAGGSVSDSSPILLADTLIAWAVSGGPTWYIFRVFHSTPTSLPPRAVIMRTVFCLHRRPPFDRLTAPVDPRAAVKRVPIDAISRRQQTPLCVMIMACVVIMISAHQSHCQSLSDRVPLPNLLLALGARIAPPRFAAQSRKTELSTTPKCLIGPAPAPRALAPPLHASPAGLVPAFRTSIPPPCGLPRAGALPKRRPHRPVPYPCPGPVPRDVTHSHSRFRGWRHCHSGRPPTPAPAGTPPDPPLSALSRPQPHPHATTADRAPCRATLIPETALARAAPVSAAAVARAPRRALGDADSRIEGSRFSARVPPRLGVNSGAKPPPRLEHLHTIRL
ncbi:hypothetical protein Rsub_02786 [Raphidocelis subcapitata]|uniref:Uncharacterized protein n=1 Tax=Raphidocelis subcapitata TaxID=307507 RepID=A0A2V0NQY0_9CHLO|nr:hypothetical protein Rsub_02786 [Raphidocelis subcapitata]|eukprot:GBF90078.1 hypothetical protein Rsub_02786 [Raphidocelis subcapitata]